MGVAWLDIAMSEVSEVETVGAEGPDVAPAFAMAPDEHFWNLPNTITVFRIACVPVMLLIPFAETKLACQILASFFILAATSDIVDGWLARRGNVVTRVGKLLDPLADKLLVATALIMLLAQGRIPMWGSWMVVVIVGRELAVTGLRGIASSHGHIVPAAWPGKVKAVAQNVAITALLFHYTTLGMPAHTLGLIFLTAATALTLWSGYIYFADYFGWRTPAQAREA